MAILDNIEQYIKTVQKDTADSIVRSKKDSLEDIRYQQGYFAALEQIELEIKELKITTYKEDFE